MDGMDYHTLRSRFACASGRRTADMATRLPSIMSATSLHASSIGTGYPCDVRHINTA